MTDGYEILFRPEVEDDLKAIGGAQQKRALAAIEERLSSNPEQYGKPLGGNLAGLRRIRFGDHRIAYQVKGRQVVIWAVLNRKDIYTELVRRVMGR